MFARDKVIEAAQRYTAARETCPVGDWQTRIEDAGWELACATREYNKASVTDDSAKIADHSDAWNLSHLTRASSNLARAYIELRDLAKVMWEGPITDGEQDRLKTIIHSNDL